MRGRRNSPATSRTVVPTPLREKGEMEEEGREEDGLQGFS